MSSRFKNHLDLDQMPVIQKQNLCDILDQNDSWKELGVLMQFELLDPDIVVITVLMIWHRLLSVYEYFSV